MILSKAKIALVETTKLALRLATKVELINSDKVHSGVLIMKTVAKTAFSLMKAKGGDQKPTPATKIAATARLMRLVRVKQEFISPLGFSA